MGPEESWHFVKCYSSRKELQHHMASCLHVQKKVYKEQIHNIKP